MVPMKDPQTPIIYGYSPKLATSPRKSHRFFSPQNSKLVTHSLVQQDALTPIRENPAPELHRIIKPKI